MSALPRFARAACAPDFATDSNAEASAVASWNPDIVRAAKAAARRRGLRDVDPFADDAAQEARITVALVTRRGISDERYLRRSIANSVQNSGRQTMVAANEVSPDGLDAAAEASRERDFFVEERVRTWVAGQPPQLQAVYDLLYRQDASQREAAQQLGVSQPRIARLHGELIERGRGALKALAG